MGGHEQGGGLTNTYYRIDVKPPGSPGWLKFRQYETRDEAIDAAFALRDKPILYERARVWRVEETLEHDTGTG
jgi:hypothetical protein